MGLEAPPGGVLPASPSSQAGRHPQASAPAQRTTWGLRLLRTFFWGPWGVWTPPAHLPREGTAYNLCVSWGTLCMERWLWEK